MKDLDDQLIDACTDGNLELVKNLIKQGADVHVEDDLPLITSVEEGYLDVAKYLVSQGADVHIEEDWLLSYADSFGHDHIVNYLESLILKEKRLGCLHKI